MKIGPNLKSFNISAKGMSVQKRKMDLIAENIANTGTTKTSEGTPYRRKFIQISSDSKFSVPELPKNNLKLKVRDADHMEFAGSNTIGSNNNQEVISSEVLEDETPGEMVYMPDHPDADEEGYVQMPNVNVVNEMVDMIAATRSFEANLTAFNASKQIVKDSLEI